MNALGENNMKFQEAVHQRIFDIQKKRMWTDADLARYSGLSKSTVSTFKNNSHQVPSFPVLGKILNAYQMTLSEFFDCDLFEENGEIKDYEY